MKKIKEYCLKALPYFVCIIASYTFFLLSKNLNSDIKSLMLAIAGSFLSIPVLYLIYELSKKFSQKRLNKELFDYSKMQIDRNILSIINQLMKLVQPYKKVSLSSENVRNFLFQSRDKLITTVKTNEYLGFQVFKNWSITEKNITKILENPFILRQLGNDQVIAIIDLSKRIRTFDFMLINIENLYTSTRENAKGYKIESGKNFNEQNTKYPDRYLLLKNLGGNKYQVRDFGDFAAYQTEKLLQIYKINDKYLDYFVTALFGLINSIKHWVELTGYGFLIDAKMFRPSLRKNQNL